MTLKVGVIGACALGTAISQTISKNVNQLLLHVRKQELCDINNTGYNTQYYPARNTQQTEPSRKIGKEIDISISTGEFIGVSKVSKSDLPKFNEILEALIDEDKQNYYDFAFNPLSKIRTIDYVLTNGRKWTEIDDHNDWNHAQKLIDEIEN